MRRIFLSGLVLFGIQTGAGAQELTSQTVEQLGSLGRVWSAVRVIHPWAAENIVSWDSAFVTTTESILNSSNCDSFVDAIDAMLGELDDDETQVIGMQEIVSTLPAVAPEERLQKPSASWLNDQTILIDGSDWFGLTSGAGGLNAMHNPMFIDVFAEADEAQTVILDFRRPVWDRNSEEFDMGAFMLSAILRREIAQLLATPVIMPTQAVRQHYGYQNQGITSEAYHSGHYIRDHRILAPADRDTTPKNIVFWINALDKDAGGVSAIADLLSAVQTSGAGIVITEEGGIAEIDPFSAPNGVPLACGATATIRSGVMVNADGSIGFKPAATVSVGKDQASWLRATKKALRERSKSRSPTQDARFPIVAQSEPRYADMKSPSAGYRLLGLVKFWAAINYFSPYKDLIDQPWDDVLEQFVPEFFIASDAAAYAKAVARLGVRTQDSHTSISAQALTEYLGSATVPLIAREIEGESVVTWAGDADGLAQIEAGDIVLTVDDMPIKERLDFLLEFTPGSNDPARLRNAHFQLFSGQEGSALRLKVRKADGSLVSSSVQRSAGATPKWTAYGASKTMAAAEMVDAGIGYLDLSRVNETNFEDSLTKVADARQMIFDMRGYPNIPVTMVMARLAQGNGVGASLSVPLIRSLSSMTQTAETIRQPFAANAQAPVPGQVAILVNRWSQSAAEHTILFLKAAFGERATIIGEPSAGANGTITYAYLPGGITVSFTGMAVAWPDGRQLQRLGVQPDRVVRPTIGGLRARRDEILEAALGDLKASNGN